MGHVWLSRLIVGAFAATVLAGCSGSGSAAPSSDTFINGHSVWPLSWCPSVHEANTALGAHYTKLLSAGGPTNLTCNYVSTIGAPSTQVIVGAPGTYTPQQLQEDMASHGNQAVPVAGLGQAAYYLSLASPEHPNGGYFLYISKGNTFLQIGTAVPLSTAESWATSLFAKLP